MTFLPDSIPDIHTVLWPWWLSSMIKSTLWLAAGLAAGGALRRQPASVRHGAALITALGIPLIWLLNLSPIPEAQGWQPTRKWTASVIHGEIQPSGTIAETTADKSGRIGSAPVSTPPRFPWRESVLAAWALGGAAMALRLLAAARTGQRESRRFAILTEGRLPKILAEECRRAGLARCPALALGAVSAMVAGWRRPVIALPEDATAWPEAKTRAILRHELAHVARRDVLWSWLAEWALLPLWPHPLARVLRRRLAESREHACDDAVLHSGIPAADYAENLLSLLPGAPAPAAPARLWAHPPGPSVQRFRYLLDPRAPRHTASRWRFGAMAALALPVLVAGTLLLGCAGPRPLAPPVVRFPQTNPERLPDLPRHSKLLNVDLAFFELTLPEAQASQLPDFAAGMKDMGRVMSPEDGWQLFHPSRKGLDQLATHPIGVRPGQRGKIEIGKDFPIPMELKKNEKTGKLEPVLWENKKTGVMADLKVRRGRTPRYLDLNLTAEIVEFDGFYHLQDLDFDAPRFYTRRVAYNKEIENGSYIILGAKTEEQTVENAAPGLGRLPLIGKAFTVKTKQKVVRLAAVRVIVRPAGDGN